MIKFDAVSRQSRVEVATLAVERCMLLFPCRAVPQGSISDTPSGRCHEPEAPASRSAMMTGINPLTKLAAEARGSALIG
jgi:hypothetical protein